MNVQLHLLCETIEGIKGIQFIRQEIKYNFIFRLYEGFRGMVIIDYDEDNFTEDIGRGYLKQLGLEHLIESMFPATPTVIHAPNECTTCSGIGVVLKEEDYVTCTNCNGKGVRVA
jgi:hypothetical protein